MHHEDYSEPLPHLFLLGGSVPLHKGHRVMVRVKEALGEGPVILCPEASSKPDEVIEDYNKFFGDIGVRTILADFRDISRANDAKVSDLFKEAVGVFFTGGDQLKLSKLKATLFMSEVKNRGKRGKLKYIGTSAGATFPGDEMLVGGPSGMILTAKEAVETSGGGLGLFDFMGRDVIIDMHYAAALLPQDQEDMEPADQMQQEDSRVAVEEGPVQPDDQPQNPTQHDGREDEREGRAGRLLKVLSRNPTALGFGISAGTILEVDGWIGRVWGDGFVEVLDLCMARRNNAHERSSKPLSVGPYRGDRLFHGDEFSLKDWLLPYWQLTE